MPEVYSKCTDSFSRGALLGASMKSAHVAQKLCQDLLGLRVHMYYGLHCLKGGYIGDYKGGYKEFRQWFI